MAERTAGDPNAVGTAVTVGAAVRAATTALAASASPRLDAEVLLARALGVDRARVLARGRECLSADEAARFAALVGRRAAGEPVAYITGCAWFCGLALEVNPAVLIPRPETELLVEWAASRLAARDRAAASDRAPARGGAPARTGPVVDVGTGSGAVALALTSRLPGLRIWATDRSAAALAVARRNAARLGLAGRIVWRHADLLPESPRRFDVVVANLPYVGLDEIADVSPEVVAWEPGDALFAGPDGLAEIRRLLARLPGRLAPGADVGLEIGWRQGPAVTALAEAALPGGRVSLHLDLAGLPRLVTVEGVPMPGRV